MPASSHVVKALRPLTRAASTASTIPELSASREVIERHLANVHDASSALRDLPARVAEYKSWTPAQPQAKKCWSGVVTDLQ